MVSTSNRNAQLALGGGVVGLILVAGSWWAQSHRGAQLLPHAYCITGSPALLWLHVISDALITLAYLVIPLALLHIVRQRADIPFGWMGLLFGAFIVACGLTHAMQVWTVWDPVYWYSGVLKAFTAAVSLATAWVLVYVMPRVLALPSSSRLQSDNQLLERMFDVASVGVVVFDQELRFVRINRWLAEANGLVPSAFAGRKLEDVLPHADPKVAEVIRWVRDNGKPMEGVEITRRQPDGSSRQWVISYFPIEMGGAAPLIGGVIQDVTSQRQAERQRMEALEAAEGANKLKDQFLARVSHELRSPLQSLMTGIDLLRLQGDLPAQGLRVLDRISTAVRTQAAMINDLLDVSRILGGRLQVSPERVDPAALLARCLDRFRPQVQAKGLYLDEGQMLAGQGLVDADPLRLEKVFANLLDNAVHFTPQGGRIQIAAAVRDGHWRLRVTDSGIGIAKDDLERIFQAFGHGRPDGEAPRRRGLGLGLAIAGNLARMFGGKLWAESEGTGQGATFTLELPLASGKSGVTTGARQAPARDRLDGVRILYVEDDEHVAQMMQLALTALGAQVQTAASSEEALERLKTFDCDVLLSDLDLGEGPSGVDLLRAVRQIEGRQDLLAIAVSAFGSAEHMRATAGAGFAAHLVKPIPASVVCSTIRGQL